MLSEKFQDQNNSIFNNEVYGINIKYKGEPSQHSTTQRRRGRLPTETCSNSEKYLTSTHKRRQNVKLWIRKESSSSNADSRYCMFQPALPTGELRANRARDLRRVRRRITNITRGRRTAILLNKTAFEVRTWHATRWGQCGTSMRIARVLDVSYSILSS